MVLDAFETTLLRSRGDRRHRDLYLPPARTEPPAAADAATGGSCSAV